MSALILSLPLVAFSLRVDFSGYEVCTWLNDDLACTVSDFSFCSYIAPFIDYLSSAETQQYTELCTCIGITTEDQCNLQLGCQWGYPNVDADQEHCRSVDTTISFDLVAVDPSNSPSDYKTLESDYKARFNLCSSAPLQNPGFCKRFRLTEAGPGGQWSARGDPFEESIQYDNSDLQMCVWFQSIGSSLPPSCQFPAVGFGVCEAYGRALGGVQNSTAEFFDAACYCIQYGKEKECNGDTRRQCQWFTSYGDFPLDKGYCLTNTPRPFSDVYGYLIDNESMVMPDHAQIIEMNQERENVCTSITDETLCPRVVLKNDANQPWGLGTSGGGGIVEGGDPIIPLFSEGRQQSLQGFFLILCLLISSRVFS